MKRTSAIGWGALALATRSAESMELSAFLPYFQWRFCRHWISANYGKMALRLNGSRKTVLRILLLSVVCLWQSGCFELILRSPSERESAGPSWSASGNLGEGRDVQLDSIATVADPAGGFTHTTACMA